MRIASEIIRRAKRIEDLTRKEAKPTSRSFITGGAVDETVHTTGIDKIRLLQKIVERTFLPILGNKSPIALGWLDRFSSGLHHGIEPECAHLLKVVLLHLRKLGKALEIADAPTFAQQLGREVQHQ